MGLISVILNVYKRPHMLDKQIDAMLNQSIIVRPENIHVWYNKSDVEQYPPKQDGVKTYLCNWNTKFHGRFLPTLLCDTQYIAIFDDDVIPGKNWLRNCINTINTKGHNGILGGSGILVGDLSKKFVKYGWNGIHSNEPQRVDFIGQAWFMRQEWAKYIWYEKPYTWDNAEDIMFCYLAQKYGGVNTFVPPHPKDDHTQWSTSIDVSMGVGRDENASWRKGGHTDVRKDTIKHCIDNGWEVL